MNTKHDIKLICFDLGGICVEICTGWHQASQNANANISQDKAKALDQARIDDHSVFGYETGKSNTQDFAIAAGKHVNLPPQQIKKAFSAWLLKTVDKIPPLIKDLSDKKIPLACLSNTNEIHWHQMLNENSHCPVPLHLMQHHFTSQTIGHVKPNHEIYQHVEQKIALPPQQILFFDDTLPNITTAKERNWQAHHIHRDKNVADQINKALSLYNLIPTKP